MTKYIDRTGEPDDVFEREVLARVGDPMTPVPSSPVALLDQLDELRAKATPGPWQQDDEYPEDIVAPRTAGLDVASCDEGPADAALIVASVNAVGPLTAAVRAVLELADKWESEADRADDAEPVNSDGLTRMILAARYLRMSAADLRAALDAR